MTKLPLADLQQALDEALREKADLEKENKALFEENAALSKRVEVLSEQSAQWKQVSTIRWTTNDDFGSRWGT
jgi:FtsZ-binding cell division protein ZapB